MKLVPDYASPAVGGQLHHGAPVARSNDAALSNIGNSAARFRRRAPQMSRRNQINDLENL
jgi:hypothetical protein